MSETNKTPYIFSDPFRSELEGIVETAIKKALNGNGNSTMLTAEQLAKKLQVNKATASSGMSVVFFFYKDNE